jgi:hypothetical protein
MPFGEFYVGTSVMGKDTSCVTKKQKTKIKNKNKK